MPVALESASVSAASSSSVWTIADRVGHVRQRHRILDVAPRCRVGEEEVVAHQAHEDLHVAGRKAHPRGDACHELDSHVGVIARVALAEVVEPRGDEEEIGPARRHGQVGRFRGRFQEMPIDGEAVVRVVLRAAPHRFPFGKHACDEPVLVERLERGDRECARREELHQCLARLAGPRITGRGGLGAEAVERRAGDRRTGCRRRGRDPQRQRRIVQRRIAGDDDLAIALRRRRR